MNKLLPVILFHTVEEKADKDQSDLIMVWKQINKGQRVSGETVGPFVVLDKHTIFSLHPYLCLLL